MGRAPVKRDGLGTGGLGPTRPTTGDNWSQKPAAGSHRCKARNPREDPCLSLSFCNRSRLELLVLVVAAAKLTAFGTEARNHWLGDWFFGHGGHGGHGGHVIRIVPFPQPMCRCLTLIHCLLTVYSDFGHPQVSSGRRRMKSWTLHLGERGTALKRPVPQRPCHCCVRLFRHLRPLSQHEGQISLPTPRRPLLASLQFEVISRMPVHDCTPTVGTKDIA